MVEYNNNVCPQQTREVTPMQGQCWASVVDAGPTLTQHWVNVLFAGTCLQIQIVQGRVLLSINVGLQYRVQDTK